MKVLHVDTEKGFRGGEQQLLWLAEGLAQKGIDTAVACIEDKLYLRCSEAGIKTIKLSKSRVKNIKKLIKISDDFDIIHAHTSNAHTICALAKIFKNKPLIYTRRVDYKPKGDPITKFKYKITDKIICVARYVCEVLRHTIGIEELVVIHSSTNPLLEKMVDPEKVRNIKNQFKPLKIIGTATALTTQKNIPNLIEAAEIVLKRRSDVVFLVVGEGALKDKIRELIERKKMAEKFKLIGFKKDIENYIKAFDLFVLPSDFEGLSGAVLNAMLLKIPVVSTDAGGLSEVVFDKETGILVQRNNPEILAKAIETVLEDKDLRKKIVENAYRLVKENFSVDKMVEKYIKLYKELLEEKQ
ncbi:glycosyltransferase family 4 protein [Hippea maritima]|uniref:Glycosyl transferase group 1 n=1 Tax=Hippea maritima (strain ATCC 700847 / DSM 10411 / MH2) TaxID=760142 RepID=F2LTI7_HIPMA|nr:glycosyltransferase family 4 protein [Hippea maritima]AEA33312.1 glycosyl transferase group 1 [Hippea maritima DSM 10411]